MSTTAALMTVEEFQELADPPGFYLELHHGEVVQLTRPKYKHFKIQTRLNDAFNRINGQYGISACEFAFRPKPEHNLWCADVAFVSKARERAIDPEDYLAGAPDIVVEVLSPSNTVSEMLDKKTICLENGCREFWVVDPRRKLVEVTRAEGTSKIYRLGDSILVLPGNGEITVNEIFSEGEEL
ncbi:MAG: Uma2 family endonuclease [Bryobacteraceae bacterium]